MGRGIASLLSAAVALLLTIACADGDFGAETDDDKSQGTEQEPAGDPSDDAEEEPAEDTENPSGDADATEGEDSAEDEKTENIMEIGITIGGRMFAATIEDSATGRAFAARLPMTLDMSELNGNEKYFYLNESLPAAAKFCAAIEAGDLMLYGDSCIVLFYGRAGGYSYTRIGRLTQTEGLAEAVGHAGVRVTFEAAQ